MERICAASKAISFTLSAERVTEEAASARTAHSGRAASATASRQSTAAQRAKRERRASLNVFPKAMMKTILAVFILCFLRFFVRQKADQTNRSTSTFKIYHKISGEKSKFCEK
jgi:hypothetical protein